MAEGAGLENRYTGNGIVGSNPTLSVPPPIRQQLLPGDLSVLLLATAPRSGRSPLCVAALRPLLVISAGIDDPVSQKTVTVTRVIKFEDAPAAPAASEVTP